MTGILLLATIALAVLLANTRQRLGVLERLEKARGLAAANDTPAVPGLADAPEFAPSALVQDSPTQETVMQDAVPDLVAIPEEQTPALPTDQPAVADLATPRQKPVTRSKIASAASGFGFEDLFGRKLPIWAGGITLIVAAVLMVRYSIDTGLLSPTVRVLLGLVFGAGLVGGAEFARKRADFVRDGRVAQALAGAGVGALYAATLAATSLYGLIGSGTGFAGLAAVTALALGLALRFGAPCAVLGLIGGLAAPAVVQSASPSVPLLAGYLAIVIGAITLLSRRQRWIWLGLGALVGGAGWSLFTIAMGGLDSASTLSIGLLVVLLAMGLPAFATAGRSSPWLRAGAAVVGALQLALLVATGDFAPLTWGLYGLLSLAFVWLAAKTAFLRRTVPVPLLTALGLAVVWPVPEPTLFAAVMAGIVLIYGGYALWQVGREKGLVEVGLLAAVAFGGYAACRLQFYTGAAGQDLRFALLALIFALPPAIAAGLGWRLSTRKDDVRFALLSLSAGGMAVLAGLAGLAPWTAPITFAAVGTGLLALAIGARDHRLSRGALGFLAGAVGALAITDDADAQVRRLFEVVTVPHLGRALLQWSAVTLAAAAFAWRSADARIRLCLQPIAVLLGYGLVAQVVPAPWLAVATAAALALLAEIDARKSRRALVPAQVTVAALLALWALAPLAFWAFAGLESLSGLPVMIGDLPEPGTAIRRLIVPVLATAIALWRGRSLLTAMVERAIAIVVAGLGLIGIHILYKQLFMIESNADFIRLGLAERTVWEAALMVAGVAVWRGVKAREAALGLVFAGLAHGVLYTMMLHDPLWSQQAVGPWPLLNLLLPAFGIAFVAPSLVTRIMPALSQQIQRPSDILRMSTILLFAFATLRQLFAGSMLTHTPIGEVENIGQSALAIALALGFLGWGIREGLRDWRIASLVLMLGAVAKVFLLDASGLEGLLRIASFLALGFSLIGIGWLYSRYLKPDAG